LQDFYTSGTEGVERGQMPLYYKPEEEKKNPGNITKNPITCDPQTRIC
jgi:hypothetical protein